MLSQLFNRTTSPAGSEPGERNNMKSMYLADKNGNLIYWVTECGGKIIREYPDGHTESANEQEIKLYNRGAALPPL